MRAIVNDKQGVRVVPDYQPVPRAADVPVRILVAGICETDLQLMQGYMGFCGVLGHEFVGVAERGKFAGQRVVGEINCACGHCGWCHAGLPNHCPHRTVIGILGRDGAFADVVFVPQENLHVVPDSIPNDVAVFTEPLAAACQIPTQVDMSRHPTAVVVGDGRLAYLVAQVLRCEGAEVTVVGKHELKLQAFESQGFQVEQVTDGDVPRNHSLAVDCSGSITGIPTALRWLQPRGTLVLKTTISGDHGPGLAPIVIDEITVIGSRCGPFPAALRALQAGRIDVTSLITSRYPLEDGETALRAAASSSQRKVLLDVGKAT